MIGLMIKKRLNEMGKNNKLPGRENYKKEMNQTLEKLKHKSMEIKNQIK